MPGGRDYDATQGSSMRPGQNKRMRGRTNNRKGPNPLTRSYESNGPDVKIRGTAHHIGEKYLQLARDAQSSGDGGELSPTCRTLFKADRCGSATTKPCLSAAARRSRCRRAGV